MGVQTARESTGISGLATRNAVVKSCLLIFPPFFLTIPLTKHCHRGRSRRGEAALQLKTIDEREGMFVPWFALAARCRNCSPHEYLIVLAKVLYISTA